MARSYRYAVYNGFGHDIRAASWQWLKAEYAAGRVARPTRCEVCGETRGQLDHHAEDYSRPFGPHIHAFALCFRCHMMLHSRFFRQALWLRYIEQLEAGAAYAPLMHRGEICKLKEPGWVERPVSWGSERGLLLWFRALSMTRVPERGQGRLFEE